MKKLFYAAILLSFIGFAKSADAQVSVNINIGSQPSWGPSGYDYARYYYMPELDVYYDVSSRHYVYLQGSSWVTHASLPRRHRGIDLYRTRKVVINDSYPWKRHKHHRSHYSHRSHNRSHYTHRTYNRRDRVTHNHRAYDRYDGHKRYSKGSGSKHYKKSNHKHYKSHKKHRGHR